MKLTENYKDKTRQNYLLTPDNKKWEFLYNLIVNNLFSYHSISGILKISIDRVIYDIFIPLDIKICSKDNCCASGGRIQSRNNFYLNKNTTDGLKPYCKDCVKKQTDERKKEKSEYDRKYRYNNPQYCKRYTKNYRERNKERLKLKNKIKRNSFASYDIYAKQLNWIDYVRRDPENSKLLQVKCYENSCRKWFNPTNEQVCGRLRAIYGKEKLGTQNNFYCSDECKANCLVYRKVSLREDQKFYRSDQPELRRLKIEQVGYKCQRCGKEKDELEKLDLKLNCHHIEGIHWESLESADLDKVRLYCDQCHRQVHLIEGCKPSEMRCYGSSE